MSTILIIEDDQNLREGLELLFQIEGFDTLAAADGLAGLDLAREKRPDVLVTNYQMPIADGLDVLRGIRTDPDLAGTPVLFLTANHMPSIREQAVRDGADVFLTKPFDTTELVRTVVMLAASSKAHEPS